MNRDLNFKRPISTTSVNFTGQKLEKLETRKLENDFRVREVQKTQNKKILKLENLINFTELHELENMNFTKLHELEILNINII